MRNFRYIFIALILLCTAIGAAAQSPRQAKRQAARESRSATRAAKNALPALEDAVSSEEIDPAEIARLDSIAARDSIFTADSLRHIDDSLRMLSASSLKVPAFTAAGDSIVEVFKDGKKMIYYYGGVTVEYENLKLTADYMEYDLNTGTVYARGTLDTLTGEITGMPEMTQGAESYQMEELRYNFNTQRARITNMTTHDSEGELRGRDIKMFEDKSINIKNGKYTVCDAEEPHYYLKMTVAKVMTKPSQKTVFGPAFPVIGGVTLPIGIPYGFIPPKPQRATGFLMPTFGEEQARGFYMRDAGMYFVIGDFFDISITGDLYTMGSWALDVNSRYKVNYKFSGNLGLNISTDVTGEKGAPDYFETKNFGLKWSHSMDSKAHPGMSFSASVNFSSPSNSKYHSRSVNEALQSQTSSSISFSRNWNGRFNLSVNGLHSQNTRDSSYTFTLPNITFSVATFYPFKQKHRVGKEKFYEKISFGYNTTLQNKINFKASEFGQDGFLDKFQNGMAHNFSIGLPSFTLLKYFTFNPGVSYGMNWFFRKSEAQYNEETDRVELIQGKQFGTFGITQTYSGSVSMSTRLYGMFNFGKYSTIQAIRHVITPSVSLSYSPELGTPANGWRDYVYKDKHGEEKTYSYNIYQGGINSYPGKGQNGNMSVTIGNNVEAKIRDFADTTGTGTKKIKLIDNLSFNGSYNFLADSLKMSNIGASLSTSVFGKLGINANANFDPYAIDEMGRKINKFNVLQQGLGHILRLTNASFSLSYSLSGEGAIKGNDGSADASGEGGGGGGSNPANFYKRVYYHPVTGEYIPGGWLYYTNPNVPWSINFNYNFAYSKSYSYTNNELVTNNKITQTLGISGNLKLTPRLSINATSGFDFTAMKITTTQVSATYDLHCFNISVSWVPTGQWKSYSFRIAANASALADVLKFKKSSSYWDN